MENAQGQHYCTDSIECIDAIRAALGKEGFIAYCRGNMLRYVWRLGKKDEDTVEAQKAIVYGKWIINTICDQPLEKPHA